MYNEIETLKDYLYELEEEEFDLNESINELESQIEEYEEREYDEDFTDPEWLKQEESLFDEFE